MISMAAPGSFIVVSGGDSRYYPLIRELVDSIRALKPASECPIGLLDAGMRGEEIAEFRAEGIAVVTPPWPVDVPAYRTRNRNYLKADLGKPHLASYFPGYETIIWVDADAWVQDWDAIELLREGASRGAFAIVPHAGRYADTEIAFKWVLGPFARVRSTLYKNAARSGLTTSECRALAHRATLNAGVFALRADAPHWEAFQRWQKRVVVKGRLFTSDQLAMAASIYIDGLPLELMPDWCNYMGPWRFDPKRNELVEFYLPRRKIGIVHLTKEDLLRTDPSVLAPVPDLSGNIHQLGLRYPSWAKELVSA
jgi:hypothetical protein